MSGELLSWYKFTLLEQICPKRFDKVSLLFGFLSDQVPPFCTSLTSRWIECRLPSCHWHKSINPLEGLHHMLQFSRGALVCLRHTEIVLAGDLAALSSSTDHCEAGPQPALPTPVP